MRVLKCNGVVDCENHGENDGSTAVPITTAALIVMQSIDDLFSCTCNLAKEIHHTIISTGQHAGLFCHVLLLTDV